MKRNITVSALLSLVLALGISAPAWAAPAIDVRPGSDQNVVNPNAKGMIQIALLGDAEFDVNGVAITALRLSAQGSSSSAEPKGHGRAVDVNNDGFLDLVLNFPIQGTGVKSGDTQICLAGPGFEACDAIETVPR